MMMTISERVAYLKGLTEGMKLDDNKDETKLLKAIIDVLDDVALSVADLEDATAMMQEQVDAVDEDLDELEEFVYTELDDEDYEDFEDEECFEVECPACHETICVDEEILEDGGIECPNCGEFLEFEIDEDCGCGCDNCKDED